MTPLARASLLFVGLSTVTLASRGAAASSSEDFLVPNPGPSRTSASFVTSVPIELPPVHGAPPALALAYDSSLGDGHLGFGWRLAGAPYIERRSKARGAPRFDVTDAFFVDGEARGELDACLPGGASPSCKYGGSHAPRFESFQRVALSGGAWTLTARDGTQYRYGSAPASRLDVAGGTFRWYLDAITDTHGNTTTYSYTADPAPCGDVYPAHVAYPGATVDLYYEARPDVLHTSAGACAVHTDRRLKSVDVKVDAHRARAYALAYAQSASAKRSLLASVTLHGTTATVSAAGVVSGGLTRALATLGYAADPGAAFAPLTTDEQSAGASPFYGQPVLLDFDGDGVSDRCVAENCDGTTCGAQGVRTICARGQGDGTFAAEVAQSLSSTMQPAGLAETADLNADGMADLCWLASDGTVATACAISKGDGTFGALVRTDHATVDWTQFYPRLADVTGDGIPDLCAAHANTIRCMAGKGDGTFGAIVSDTSADSLTLGNQRPVYRDVDGDGRLDVCNADPTLLTATCLRSRGDGSFDDAVTTSVGGGLAYTEANFGDLDGDGVVDVCGRKSGAALVVSCALGQGDGHFGARRDVTLSTASLATQDMTLVDVTGDGKDDVCFTHADPTGMHVACAPGLGDGTFAALVSYHPTTTDSGGYATIAFGDVDGDGAHDVCALRAGATLGAKCLRSKSVRPNLLASLKGQLGGVTTVTYASSSAWPNGDLPLGVVHATVSAVGTDDGRGDVAVHTTAYDGGHFSRAERRFLGFRTSTEVIDAAGTRRVTTYRQTLAAEGLPESVRLENAAGAAYTYQTMAYDETTSAPFRALLVDRSSYECDLTASCRRVRSKMGYDEFGNATLEQDYGDVAVTGDELTVQARYVANTTAFVVSRRAAQNQYKGLDPTIAANLVARTEHLYDGAALYTSAPTIGDETKTRAWNSLDGGYVETSRAYDAFGNLTTTANPRGSATTTTWDLVHHTLLESTCNALGQCAKMTYDPALAAVTSQTDANGNVTTFAFDTLGRPTMTTFPNKGWRETLYVGFGNPTTQYVETIRSDGSSNGLWSIEYVDGLGRTYRRTREGGFTELVEFAEDVPTRVARASEWFAASETPRFEVYEYDGASRVTRTTHPDATFARTDYAVGVRTDYDEAGNPKTVFTDGWGRAARLRETNGGNTADTTRVYDALGRLVTSTDALGHASTSTFDSLGRVALTCNPDTGCSQLTYDAAGGVTQSVDAKGQAIKVAYDPLERVTSRTHPDGSRFAWTYDESGHGAGIGQATTHVFPGGSDAFTYDFAGRTTSETRCRESMCATTGATYDTTAEGRLASVVYPDETVKYTYAASGDLATVGGYATALTYDARGVLVKTTLANGVTETFTQDPLLFRLSSASVAKGTSALYKSDITYLSNRLVARVATTNGTLHHDLSFDYDDLDRVTSVSDGTGSTQSFAYDAIGNMTYNSRVGAYAYASTAHVHAVTKAGASAFVYDANGNTTSNEHGRLVWDAENRLKSAVDVGAGITLDFVYDGAGRRVEKKQGATTVRYFGARLEHDGTNLVKYVYAGDRLLARRVGTGTKYFFHQDHLGSTRLVTDGAGAAVQRYAYGPFGDLLASDGAFPTDIQFTGQRADDASHLVYMGARYYDPAIARFVSPDSIVPSNDPQHLNRYSYARNRPLNFVDPTGHADGGDGQSLGGGGAADGNGGTSNQGNKESKNDFSTHPSGSEAFHGVGHSEHIGGGKDKYVIDDFVGTLNALPNMSQKMQAMAARAVLDAVKAAVSASGSGAVPKRVDIPAVPGTAINLTTDIPVDLDALAALFPGKMVVVIHGNIVTVAGLPSETNFTTARVNGALVSVDQLAGMIESSPGYLGQDVVLMACESGAFYSTTAKGLAAVLSDINDYPTNVTAPTSDTYFAKYVDVGKYLGMQNLDRYGQPTHFQTYGPDDAQRVGHW